MIHTALVHHLYTDGQVMGKHYTPVCAAQVLPLNSLPMIINMTQSLWAKENVKLAAQYQNG